MAVTIRQKGFSIAEVLIAVGLLAVAMIFIAGVFPVGIRFTQVSIDRTNAAIAASEAFAKVQLYANRVTDANNPLNDLSFREQRDFNDWFTGQTIDYYVDVNTYSYPTDNTIDFNDKEYCWSALLRRTDRFIIDPNLPDSSRDIQVTVFVCSRPRPNAKYCAAVMGSLDFRTDNYGTISGQSSRLPQPVRIEVARVSGGRDNELQITTFAEKTLINDGDLIVDDPTGRIYRVMERYNYPDDDIILLDKDFVRDDWRGGSITGNRFVWVVTPPWVSGCGLPANLEFGDRNPCVGVYQKVIRF